MPAGQEHFSVDQHPVTLLCREGPGLGNDVIGLGAIDAAQSLGVAVPEAVSVLGFDDVPRASWEVFQLTTVRQPLSEIARAAARKLAERIECAGDIGPGRASRSSPPASSSARRPIRCTPLQREPDVSPAAASGRRQPARALTVAGVLVDRSAVVGRGAQPSGSRDPSPRPGRPEHAHGPRARARLADSDGYAESPESPRVPVFVCSAGPDPDPVSPPLPPMR
ncbi:LacI family transcriptional regulator [Blastococcus sp. CT_GayMR19]|nr:LacI family transcriptional regulator [Blastococcus sp. CT_GayMR19]